MPPKGWSKYKTDEERNNAVLDSWHKYRHKPGIQQSIYGPAARKWQIDNPERMRTYYRQSSKRRWIKNRAFIHRVVLFKGCQQCGYKECPAALSFHHTDPTTKLFSVRKAIARSRETLKTEMRKCIVLCNNCHNEWHKQNGRPKGGPQNQGLTSEGKLKGQRRRYVRRKQYINNILLQQRCQCCGYHKCANALMFHHREPATKLFEIAAGLLKKLEILMIEIGKCDILCGNCHAERHWGSHANDKFVFNS